MDQTRFSRARARFIIPAEYSYFPRTFLVYSLPVFIPVGSFLLPRPFANIRPAVENYFRDFHDFRPPRTP